MDSSPGSQTTATSGAAATRLHFNRNRLSWFFAALFLFVISCLCWFQSPLPVGPERSKPFSWKWWWYPREKNASRRLQTVPFTELRDVYFTNNLGWAVGESGLILHTIDRGETWILQTNIQWGTMEISAPKAKEAQSDPPTQGIYDQNVQQTISPSPDEIEKQPAIDKMEMQAQQMVPERSPPSESITIPRPPQALHCIFFLDAQTGWVVGDNGTILYTKDSGNTWTDQTVADMDESLQSVAFVNAQTGWVVGDSGTILHTQDAGNTWTGQASDTIESLQSVTFVNAQTGWVIGDIGAILHTQDAGTTWTKQVSDTIESLEAVTFVNAQTGWAVGGNGIILHTQDAGNTWTNQTSDTDRSLQSVKFVNAQIGWVVGGSGVIIHTRDAGKTWKAQTANSGAWLDSATFIDDQNGWAVGNGGTILHTQDGGNVWRAQTANAGIWFQSGTFVDARTGWAVGESGTILHTRDAGNTWTEQTANTNVWLSSIAFVNAEVGWVVGHNGAILYTQNAGNTWTNQSANTNEWFQSVAFVNPHIGWAVGYNGIILHTQDAGNTWTEQESDTVDSLQSVAFVNSQIGWVVGDAGTILHTRDGGNTWKNQTSDTVVGLKSVTFVNAQTGWVVGDEGTILHTQDAGNTWTNQSSKTEESLQSVTFVNPQIGWAVGYAGTILHTQDAGNTWTNQTTDVGVPLLTAVFFDAQSGWVFGANGNILRTQDGGNTWIETNPYRRFPSPMFFITLAGSILLLGLARVIPERKRSDTKSSIADHAVPDRPLTSKGFDALDFRPLVDGLAGFLRNKNTLGPLTLAVVGPWGSGKSSIMGLLRERLERMGIRTVWFNAWHHQDEKQLLAAFLENIRLQAVPRWLSWQGIYFRMNLIHRRVRRYWPTILLAAAVLAATTGALVALGTNGFLAQGLEGLRKHPLISSVKLAALATAIATVFKLLYGLKAFGLDPSSLLASARSKARISDMSEQTSFRHRFAQEFEDVTAALQPLTMTVFIDDLDRCDPEQVMQVMQSLNFLSSSGECFLIVGMEEKAVTNCVAVSLSEQFDSKEGKKLDPETALERRWKYARLWMEKLIQIRIPVPDPNDDQFKALLTGTKPHREQTPESFPFKVRQFLARAWEASFPIHPWLGAIIVAVLCFWGANSLLKKFVPALDNSEKPVAVAWSSNSVLQPGGLVGVHLNVPDGIPGSVLMASTNLQELINTQKWSLALEFQPNLDFNVSMPGVANNTNTNGKTNSPKRQVTPSTASETNRPAAFVIKEGQKHHGRWWIPFLFLPVLLALALRGLINVINARYDDSQDFRDALRRWSGVIQKTAKTPRAAKRLINKLRFYATIARSLRPAEETAELNENTLVAFGVVEGQIQNGKVALSEDVQELLAREASESKEGKPKGSLEQDIQDLEAALKSHPELFHYLGSIVRTEAQEDGTKA